MSEEIEIYTFTMAKIYTDQGHYAKAETIYRHLLEKDPHNQILKEALDRVTRKRNSRASQKGKDLALLFKEWLELAQKYNQKKALNEKDKPQ